MSSKLINGKDNRENIVGIELNENDVEIIYKDGRVELEPFERYILYTRPEVRGKTGKLKGNGDFKYFRKFQSKKEYWEGKSLAPYPHYFAPKNDQLMYMLKTGTTMYQGMKYEDLKVVSFDIETNGFKKDKNSTVYLISAAFRESNKTVTTLFSLDNYNNQQDMIQDFCDWVQEKNPHVLAGHNVMGFDIPFLQHCYGKALPLGIESRPIYISRRARKFRKDGHKQYEYNNVKISGREIVDTMYLAMKYDFQNKYRSYGLKSIIEQEGLIKDGRQFYDAASIKDNWSDKNEREKIKEYCKDDSLDALSLCDIMLPTYFYYVQILPMGLQETILSASGSQVNSLMVRAYLQDGRSLPKASDKASYKGGISFGNPGIYSNAYKVDVASLYPSIMLQYGIYNKQKDPEKYFLKIVKTLTEQRLKNKKLAKETGDRYYGDMEQAQKIIINSAYGFMGAPGLHFNSPNDADKVTSIGRKILQTGLDWVESKGFQTINADTDSFLYTPNRRLSDSEFNEQIKEINSLFPEQIRWEDDGKFKRVVVVKAKNYVLQDYEGNTTIKGSALKASMKEPALKEFIERFINQLLLSDSEKPLVDLYNEYALEISDVQDINRWCSSKNITYAVLTSKRKNEAKIRDALKGTNYNEGDRIHVFFDNDDSLCLNTNYTGTYSLDRLYEKLFKTAQIFKNVLDVAKFPNYKLKRHKDDRPQRRRQGARDDQLKLPSNNYVTG
jgi:DNA polymerase I